MTDSDSDAYMDLYHPRGPRVRLPIRRAHDYAQALQDVSRALDAGWLVTAPGLEAGEEKLQVGHFLRTSWEREGRTGDSLLLYSAEEHLKYSVVRVYLDNDEQVRAFESASGLSLTNLPEYVGNDKPARGSGKLGRYFVRTARPCTAVIRANPKFDEVAQTAAAAKGEVYKQPQRLFVRWEGQAPRQQQGGNGYQSEEAAPQDDGEVIGEEQQEEVIRLLRESGADFDAFCRTYQIMDVQFLTPAQHKDAVKKLKEKIDRAKMKAQQAG